MKRGNLKKSLSPISILRLLKRKAKLSYNASISTQFVIRKLLFKDDYINKTVVYIKDNKTLYMYMKNKNVTRQ